MQHRTGEARNPIARAYFEKCLGEQAQLPREKQDRKARKKALLSLMRQQAIRFYKLMKAQKLAAMAERAGGAQGGPGAAQQGNRTGRWSSPNGAPPPGL